MIPCEAGPTPPGLDRTISCQANSEWCKKLINRGRKSTWNWNNAPRRLISTRHLASRWVMRRNPTRRDVWANRLYSSSRVTKHQASLSRSPTRTVLLLTSHTLFESNVLLERGRDTRCETPGPSEALACDETGVGGQWPTDESLHEATRVLRLVRIRRQGVCGSVGDYRRPALTEHNPAANFFFFSFIFFAPTFLQPKQTDRQLLR